MTIIEEQSYCNTKICRHRHGYLCYSKSSVGNIFSLKFILKIQLRNRKSPKYCHRDLFTAIQLGFGESSIADFRICKLTVEGNISKILTKKKDISTTYKDIHKGSLMIKIRR